MSVAIVQYPGSHGAEDVLFALAQVLGVETRIVWHQEENLAQPDAVIVPGGFSFGDYLRPGILAKASPISGAVKKFALDGGPVLGIGNGFQILCELGLLPGALLMNPGAKFITREACLVTESSKTPFTKQLAPRTRLKLPVANYFGCYYADKRTLKTLEEKGHIAFRYANAEGEVNAEDNFSGSLKSIAGVVNRNENVLGLMAHPERAVEDAFGGTDGRVLFAAFQKN